MPAIKIVLGEEAAERHQEGLPDSVVTEYGDIDAFVFETQAELDAFVMGLEALDGWLGWTEYDPDNLQSYDEED